MKKFIRPYAHLSLEGKIIGSLRVIGQTPSEGRNTLWTVRCSCGSTTVKLGKELSKKMRKNSPAWCGVECPKWREHLKKQKTTHGMSRHPAFFVWRSMNDRCHLLTHHAWKNYGGRGISVCPLWRVSFQAFWETMGPTWAPKLQLDRIDNSKGYSPENCRWVAPRVNCRNKRSNISPPGWPKDFLTLTDAARLSRSTVYYRAKRRWSWGKMLEASPSLCLTSSTAGPTTDLPSEQGKDSLS